MTKRAFHDRIAEALQVLNDAGVTDFILVAFDPETEGATGVASARATSAADVTSLFHSATAAMFPEFARMNGLPSSVAAEAMREVVYLAEAAYREQLTARRELDARLRHVSFGGATES